MLINILTLFQSCIIIFMEENMGSYKYKVIKIEGDYATLIRTDISSEQIWVQNYYGKILSIVSFKYFFLHFNFFFDENW